MAAPRALRSRILRSCRSSWGADLMPAPLVAELQTLVETEGEAGPRPVREPPSPKCWVFSFGSNMTTKLRKRRNMDVPADAMVRATLRGYELSMNYYGIPIVEPAFATLVPADAEDVCCHGVAMELSVEMMHELLATEGGGGNSRVQGYRPLLVRLQVYAQDIGKREDVGEFLDAYALVADKASLLPGQLPSKRYLRLLQQGSKESELDEEYQNFLQAHPHWAPHPIGAAVLGLLMLPHLLVFRLGQQAAANGHPVSRLLWLYVYHVMGTCAKLIVCCLPHFLHGGPSAAPTLSLDELAAAYPQFKSVVRETHGSMLPELNGEDRPEANHGNRSGPLNSQEVHALFGELRGHRFNP